jgi:hypothetical protein
MQEFHDSQERQLKKLSNFELGKDNEFKKLSVYEFLFHINELNNHNQELESKQKHT